MNSDFVYKRCAAVMLAVFAMMSFSVWGDTYPLIQNGRAESAIIVTDSGPAAFFAASELADYLEKITGGRPEIRRQAVTGKYPVYFISKRAVAREIMPPDLVKNISRIRHDGFMMAARKEGLFLFSHKQRGLIYAAYEILKRYGDVRWFFPTEEGEYCPRKKNFIVPEGIQVSNPSIPGRYFNLVCYNRGFADEAFKWQLRNNMIVIGKPNYPNFHTYDMHYIEGGHCFSTLLPDKLFDSNPELFCLHNGRRYPQSGKIDAAGKRIPGTPQANQPCTTNPETLRIMKENLIKMLTRYGSVDQLMIINNDSQIWCECERCRKLDTPEERRNFKIGSRYWTLVNELTRTARNYFPYLQITVLGYQNFQEPPPEHSVLPDKSVVVPVALHQRCYAHSIGDQSCQVNRRFRRYLSAWRKKGIKTGTYEYTNMLPTGIIRWNPLEKIVVEDIKYYHRTNSQIYIDELSPYAARYQAKRWGPSVLEAQKANFMVHYLQACFLWNATADFNAVYDDAGSKFYGPAWPVIRDFKNRLAEAFCGSGIHFMYGSSGRALGKCLEDPKKEQQMDALLQQALEKTPAGSVYHKRVAYDQDCFRRSWKFCAVDYRKIRRQNLQIGKNTPVLDGNVEKDIWQKAAGIPHFKKMSSNELADPQTSVKFLYDEKNLYLAVTALEPSPDKIITRCEKHDDLVWQDNNIEMFFAPPQLDGRYLHIAFNAKGVVYDTSAVSAPDSDLSYSSGAVVKPRIGKDRWTAEIAIPWTSLGFKAAAGNRLPLNIARNRQLDGACRGTASSWNSYFHGAEIFNTIELR